MPITQNSPGTVTDVDLMQTATYLLLENGNADATGTSLLTTMFSLQMLIDTLDQKQQRFLLDTGCVTTRNTQATTPSVGDYALPGTTILIRRISWQPAGGAIKTLSRADTWELDNGMANWPTTPGTPLVWWETTEPSLKVGIAPAPAGVGQMNQLLVELGTLLTGLGIALVIPDDWAPYVMWGALGDLFGQQGAAYDPVRSAHCRRRYDEGVELARIVLQGAR